MSSTTSRRTNHSEGSATATDKSVSTHRTGSTPTKKSKTATKDKKDKETPRDPASFWQGSYVGETTPQMGDYDATTGNFYPEKPNKISLLPDAMRKAVPPINKNTKIVDEDDRIITEPDKKKGKKHKKRSGSNDTNSHVHSSSTVSGDSREDGISRDRAAYFAAFPNEALLSDDASESEVSNGGDARPRSVASTPPSSHHSRQTSYAPKTPSVLSHVSSLSSTAGASKKPSTKESERSRSPSSEVKSKLSNTSRSTHTSRTSNDNKREQDRRTTPRITLKADSQTSTEVLDYEHSFTWPETQGLPWPEPKKRRPEVIVEEGEDIADSDSEGTARAASLKSVRPGESASQCSQSNASASSVGTKNRGTPSVSSGSRTYSDRSGGTVRTSDSRRTDRTGGSGGSRRTNSTGGSGGSRRTNSTGDSRRPDRTGDSGSSRKINSTGHSRRHSHRDD